MKLLIVTMIISFSSCSTSPTQYVPSKNKQGYSDEIVDTNLRVAFFHGNSATEKEAAELYAKFRAIELCNEIGQKYAHILRVNEIGYGPVSTTTSNETYTYPSYEVYFECVTQAKDARVSLQDLSYSQVQPFVKDLMGAVQVDDVLSDSPNVGKMKKGDIIIAANGERVGNVVELYKASIESLHRSFKVEFFRDGVRKTAEIKFSDVTKLVEEAQNEIIKKACEIEGIKDENFLCD